MAESEKKRRSGRSRDESSENPEPKPKKKSGEPSEQLHQPWLPLIWLLVPLFACLAYGLATRGH